MKTQKKKTITLKTKQRKNTTLIDRSAAGTWCQRSRSGRLKTRENPFASWIMPSPVWPPTPTTKCKSSICSHSHNPKTQAFQPQKEIKKGFCSNKRRRTQPVSSEGDIISKTDVTKFYCFPGKLTSKVIVSKRTAPSSSLLPPYQSEVLLMLMCKMSNSRKLVSIKTTNNNKQIWNERF